MTLTKADIINTVYQELGFTRNLSNELIEQILKIIKSKLESGEDVQIAARKLDSYLKTQMGTITGTMADFAQKERFSANG